MPYRFGILVAVLLLSLTEAALLFVNSGEGLMINLADVGDGHREHDVASVQKAQITVVNSSKADEISYEDDIKPIFEDNCYYCHGPKKQESGLRLDLWHAVRRGGDSAEPGIVPGKSEASYLYKSIIGKHGGKRMPLKSEPLLDEEIALIKRWIDLGADWPGASEEESDDSFLKTDHWSLKPVVDPAVPASSDPWATSPIDAFILRSLDEAGLKPNAQAERRRLIRRVFFTVHGLPPTPDQMRQYLEDERTDWYPRMVDDLLASPRYGERWARHWLDLVRFAETTGFETNVPRPNAYRYRDYVIRAFNEDKPYNEFILDQLAGDATGEGAATGFLVAGANDIVSSPDPQLTAMQRSNELADMVNATTTTFMGLTVACARCHHHKFDPILHEDYYAMVALFQGVRHGDRTIRELNLSADREQAAEKLRLIHAQIDALEPLASTATDSKPIRPGVNAARNVERFEPVEARHVRIVIEQTNSGLDPCIDELEIYSEVGSGAAPVNLALASRGGAPSVSGEYGGQHRLSHLNDGAYGNARSTIAKVNDGSSWLQISLPEARVIDRVVWGRDRTLGYKDRLAVDYRIEVAVELGQWQVVASSKDRLPEGQVSDRSVSDESARRKAELIAERDRLEAIIKPPQAYAGTFQQPGPTHRLYRGEPTQKREVVAPNTITILGDLKLSVDEPERDRRVAFAKSLADPQHPLTARIMVNRLWQHHFGMGLVNTPSDFGKMGAKPTHPELLDYLASRLVENNWSIKHMQRLILNSSTYRQDSIPNNQALRADSGSTLLWRFPPRRHEAEVIRDSILQATGKLDLSMYGPGFSFFKPNENYVRVYDPRENFGPTEWRRMIYGTQVRMERDATFGSFDCPDGGSPTPKRSRSTTAIQALGLSNSPFMLQQADLFAKRLLEDAGAQPEAQVQRAYLLLYARSPDPLEQQRCMDFIEKHGLAALCRVLFNTSEFLFIE